jgi:hypothetical protein
LGGGGVGADVVGVPMSPTLSAVGVDGVDGWVPGGSSREGCGNCGGMSVG